MPMLGMSGAIHVLHLYALMAWTRKIHLYFACFLIITGVLATKPIQLKIVIIKLEPVWEDTLHV